jgi:hypothetical protein
MLFCVSVNAAGREPFSMGYGMATNGAILQQDGVSGREPFTGACFYRDSFPYGVTIAGVDYYDPMDNHSSSLIGQACLGGFWSMRGITVKAAYLHFDVMRVYYEQEGLVSIGYGLVPWFRMSWELAGFRAGLYRENDPPAQTRLEMGFSAMVPFKIAAISLNVNHIPLKTAMIDGYDAPFTIRAGLHSNKNSFGSQGVLVEMSKDDLWQFKVSIGEEYRLTKNLAASLAVTTNPVLLSFGVTCAWGKSSSVTAAFTDHPVLGWSKGLGMSWAGK